MNSWRRNFCELLEMLKFKAQLLLQLFLRKSFTATFFVSRILLQLRIFKPSMCKFSLGQANWTVNWPEQNPHILLLRLRPNPLTHSPLSLSRRRRDASWLRRPPPPPRPTCLGRWLRKHHSPARPSSHRSLSPRPFLVCPDHLFLAAFFVLSCRPRRGGGGQRGPRDLQW